MNPKHPLHRLFSGRPGLSRKAFVAAAALLSMTGIASAQYSLGVNFVADDNGGVQNGAGDALNAGEFAGAPGYVQNNWNNFGRWGNPTTLNNNLGAATTVSATWDANNTWNNGAGTGTGDNKLMNGYLDATGQVNVDGPPYTGWWNENKPDSMITGLSSWLASVGAASYSVVVYTDGDTDIGRIGEYWLQSFTGSDFGNLTLGADLTSHVFAMDSANFSGTYTQVGLGANSVGNAQAGNYLVFDGLTADAFLLRTEEQTFRAQINGYQIIANVPEPTALSLVGLSAFGWVLARRREA